MLSRRGFLLCFANFIYFPLLQTTLLLLFPFQNKSALWEPPLWKIFCLFSLLGCFAFFYRLFFQFLIAAHSFVECVDISLSTFIKKGLRRLDVFFVLRYSLKLQRDQGRWGPLVCEHSLNRYLCCQLSQSLWHCLLILFLLLFQQMCLFHLLPAILSLHLQLMCCLLVPVLHRFLVHPAAPVDECNNFLFTPSGGD